MKHPKNQYKSGATSIYVVVIATLLFSVITVSFIRIIVNEAGRTAADELAQAAYDSAVAGVEDAKVAMRKYFANCTANPSSDACKVITNNFGNLASCDAVGTYLYGQTGEIKLNETTDNNSSATQQAYTCVQLNNNLADYRATLSSSRTMAVIPLRSGDANSVKRLRISWFSDDNGSYSNTSGFPPSGTYRFGTDPSTPPTISAEIIQTGSSYTLEDFNTSSGDQTNRGTVFLVPSTTGTAITSVSASTIASSNDHVTENQPVNVKCESTMPGTEVSDEFACVADLNLPSPIGGSRADDTFFLVLSLPYGQPTTDFAVQMFTHTTDDTKIAYFQGVQISVDSTGRANDLYSRVEARIEFNDTNYPYPEFAIQAGSGGIDKNFYVTTNCKRTVSEGGNWVVKDCNNSGEAN